MVYKWLIDCLVKKYSILIIMTIVGCGNKASNDLLLADGTQYVGRWEYVSSSEITNSIYCDTIVSPDQRLAFITWNTGDGGVCPDIRNIVAWRDDKENVYRRECSVRGIADGFDEKIEGGYVYGIDTIRHYGKIVYLVTSVCYEASIMPLLGNIMIKALGIEGKHIVSVPLFDVDNEICSDIKFTYDRRDWAEKNISDKGWHGPICVQPDDKAIFIPHLAFDSELFPIFTDTFNIYKREHGVYKLQIKPFIMKANKK